MKLQEVKNISRINVFKSEVLIGKLERTEAGSIFTYDEEYLNQIEDHKLSKNWLCFQMPTTKKKYETSGVNLNPFFAGLLPEGLRLSALTAAIKTSSDDLFSLLLAVGNDCVGDVSLTGDSIIPKSRKDIEDLKEQKFSNLFEKSFSDLPEDRSFSFAGIQEKVSGNMISFPVHLKKRNKQYILKIPNSKFPQIIQNEDFFMKFAVKCGINTAKTEIVSDASDSNGLLIERFDRSYNSIEKRIIKHHQEDSCQLLNLYPADKYRVGTSPVLKVLQEFSTSSIVTAREFLKIKIFSYLIANGDLHGKNLSLLSKNGLVQLSPAYDLLSTLPYGDEQMALEFNGRKDNLKGKDFITFGSRFGLTEKYLKNTLHEFHEYSKELDVVTLSVIGFTDKKTEHLAKIISKRSAELVLF